MLVDVVTKSCYYCNTNAKGTIPVPYKVSKTLPFENHSLPFQVQLWHVLGPCEDETTGTPPPAPTHSPNFLP